MQPLKHKNTHLAPKWLLKIQIRLLATFVTTEHLVPQKKTSTA